MYTKIYIYISVISNQFIILYRFGRSMIKALLYIDIQFYMNQKKKRQYNIKKVNQKKHKIAPNIYNRVFKDRKFRTEQQVKKFTLKL